MFGRILGEDGLDDRLYLGLALGAPVELAQASLTDPTPEERLCLGIEKVDTSATEQLCRELIESNPRIVADVQGGRHQAVGALIGQAKKRNPNVNPNDVRTMCLALIEKTQ